MSDPTLHAWLRLLQAESPFPTSSFGAIEPPASADDLAERLATAFRNVATSVAMETSRADVAMPGDPEWFVALADHLLPLLSWSVGLGMGSAGSAPASSTSGRTSRRSGTPTRSRAHDRWRGPPSRS